MKSALMNKISKFFTYVSFFLVGSMVATNAMASSAMPQFDISTFPEQIFWLVVIFAILFFIMWKIALPAVHDTLVKREKKIEEDLKKAELLREEALELKEVSEKMLADARAQARNMFVKVHEELSLQEHHRMEDLQVDLDKRIKEAEKKVITAQKAYLSHAKDIAIELSSVLLERVAQVESNKEELETYVETLSKERSSRG